MLLPQATLTAMAHELEKLAETITDRDEIKKVLKPGDILLTRPNHIKSLSGKAFYAISSKVQRSLHTHVGMYAGDDKVVDAGSWTKRKGTTTGVHEVPIDTFTDRYKFKVLRVDATPLQKREAVRFVREQIGKDFNTKSMLRLLLPFKGKQVGERHRKEDAEKFFCSELVANAYNDVGIAKNKKLEHVTPGDLYHSPKTKTVATFE